MIAPSALMESFAFSRWTPPRRRTAYRSEITSAIGDLRHRGIMPSRLRVFAAMLRSSMRNSRIVDQQIAASLREVNAPPSNIACGKC